MSPIPLNVKPALVAIHNVANNKNASPEEKARSTKILAKRLRSLKKPSRKWAIILTLLATGATVAATAYAKKYGIAIPPALKTLAGRAKNTIVASRSTAAKALRKQSNSLRIKLATKAGLKIKPKRWFRAASIPSYGTIGRSMWGQK